MDYTMMIAVIGCVTGVASLLIETAQFIGGRRKARFDTFDQLNNFIYIESAKPEEDSQQVCRAVHCFLNLRVMNTGGKYILIQDVYMRRPGKKRNEMKDRVYPYDAFESTPWRYCNGRSAELPARIHLPASIPPGGVFEAVFAFTDFEDDCYRTDEHFLYPALCAVMADGSVREISVQAILAKDKDFRYVDSAEDREYSMNLDDEESFGGYADE